MKLFRQFICVIGTGAIVHAKTILLGSTLNISIRGISAFHTPIVLER